MTIYHVKYFDVAPEKRDEVPKIQEESVQAIKEVEGVEPVGLFFPRGSGYMYASVTKYKDYVTWEKWWFSAAMRKIGEKIHPIMTREMDMFFDESI